MSCKVEYDDARNYFCPRNFSLRLAKCPRTQLPVSYCDIGDPEGIPVLNIVPSACSRWVAAIQDPLCRLYGIRMIAIDRPGCGVTPAVPISQRIQLSAQMAVSVLEHIGVKPRHILVTSAGIYHALQLLIYHSEAFNDNVRLYLISPWSPHTPDTTSLLTRFGMGMVPNGIFSTQHITMPYVIKLEQYTGTLFNASSRIIKGSGGSLVVETKSTGIPSLEEIDQGNSSTAKNKRKLRIPKADRDKLHEWREEAVRITSEYLQLEESRGIGEELLVCLNRTKADTGSEWFKTHISQLETSSSRPVSVDMWFGAKDPLVSVKAQQWLVDLFKNSGIKVHVRNVKDADHDDLMKREEGIWEMMERVRNREDTT